MSECESITQLSLAILDILREGGVAEVKREGDWIVVVRVSRKATVKIPLRKGQ